MQLRVWLGWSQIIENLPALNRAIYPKKSYLCHDIVPSFYGGAGLRFVIEKLCYSICSK